MKSIIVIVGLLVIQSAQCETRWATVRKVASVVTIGLGATDLGLTARYADGVKYRERGLFANSNGSANLGALAAVKAGMLVGLWWADHDSRRHPERNVAYTPLVVGLGISQGWAVTHNLRQVLK